MLDVIICANFGAEKLRGLGNMRGQILEFPIEMAGHLYNRAGATAPPVMMRKVKTMYMMLSSQQSYHKSSSVSMDKYNKPKTLQHIPYLDKINK